MEKQSLHERGLTLLYKNDSSNFIVTFASTYTSYTTYTSYNIYLK